MNFNQLVEKAEKYVKLCENNCEDIDEITRIQCELPYDVCKMRHTYDTHYHSYKDEAAELDKLLKAMFKQIEKDVEEETDSDIIILVGDELVRLVLGGPQLDGLLALIYHIAEENWYEVNVENRTVSG